MPRSIVLGGESVGKAYGSRCLLDAARAEVERRYARRAELEAKQA